MFRAFYMFRFVEITCDYIGYAFRLIMSATITRSSLFDARDGKYIYSVTETKSEWIILIHSLFAFLFFVDLLVSSGRWTYFVLFIFVYSIRFAVFFCSFSFLPTPFHSIYCCISRRFVRDYVLFSVCLLPLPFTKYIVDCFGVEKKAAM